MQSPSPRGGSILKDEYWQLWDRDTFPNFEFILASLDTAFTDKEENDPSALTVWGIWRDESGNPKLMLVYAWSERLDFNSLYEKVLDTCVPQPVWRSPNFPVDKLIIENKGSGISVGYELHRLLRGTGNLSIELIDPKKFGDKRSRVLSIQHLFSDGMVYAPDKAWADKVIQQCSVFPKGSNDDLVDTVSQALRYLRDQGFALRRSEYADAAAEEMAYTGRSSNVPLYQT
jgi:predicted phage terminase large subunit-like protein